MKTSAKREKEILRGAPHAPFEEFQLAKTEDLVAQLEKTAPKEARVEVAPIEESHHAPCMQEMTAIMLQLPDNPTGVQQIYAMYQYCPICKTAVRVL